MSTGATNTIAESRPVMFVEVEDNWLRCFGTSAEELLNKLLSLDYILLRIKTDYPCDHVAIPKEREELVKTITQNLKYPVDIIAGKKVKLDFTGSKRPDIIYNTFQVE